MILHLTRDFPPRRSGGLSTAVGGTVAGLEAAGLACRIVSFDGYGRKGGAASDRLPRGASDDRILRIRTKGEASCALPFALAAPPTLVHVHDPFLWSLAGEITAACGARRVHTLHVLSHVQDRLRGLEAPTKTTEAQAVAIAEADALIAPAAAVARDLLVQFPSAAARLHVARLGVELQAESGDERRGALFVGRFSDLAGIGEFVETIAALAAGTPVSVAGGLPDNPRVAAKWTEALRAAAARSGAALELHGWLEPRSLFGELARASVLIAPNLYATFGLAVAEAMAAGVAVCAYRVGGLVDLIEDGKSGLLVEPSPQTLAERCIELTAAPDRSSALGAAARERIENHFSPALATRELLSVYALLAPQ